MANVYYQSSVQFVFSAKHRQALINDDFRETLHKYLGGILLNKQHKPLAINSVKDHIHLFFGMKPCDIPALVRDLKSDSSTFINENRLSRFRFQWQDGYGFFTYSMSHRSKVIKYIENQQEHHRKTSFRMEYLHILKKYEIDFKNEYLFEFFE